MYDWIENDQGGKHAAGLAKLLEFFSGGTAGAVFALVRTGCIAAFVICLLVIAIRGVRGAKSGMEFAEIKDMLWRWMVAFFCFSALSGILTLFEHAIQKL